jgi:hypothetical protein
MSEPPEPKRAMIGLGHLALPIDFTDMTVDGTKSYCLLASSLLGEGMNVGLGEIDLVSDSSVGSNSTSGVMRKLSFHSISMPLSVTSSKLC